MNTKQKAVQIPKWAQECAKAEQRDTAQRNQSGAQYTGSPSGLAEFHKWANERADTFDVVLINQVNLYKAHAERLAELLKRSHSELGRQKEHNCWKLCDDINAALAQWEEARK